jgi:hypothetical protein
MEVRMLLMGGSGVTVILWQEVTSQESIGR